MALTVRDTGIGIPGEFHGAIFESFTQVDGGPARKYGGVGLGLAISRDLARLLGGRISVESRPGSGSAFRLDLEFGRADPRPPVESAPPPLPRGLRVLAVGRADSGRRALIEHLRALGCRPEPAGSIDEARASARSAPPGDPFRLAIVEAESPAAGLADMAQVLLRSSRVQRDRAEPRDGSSGDAPELAKPVRRAALLDAMTRALRPPRPAPAATPPNLPASPVPWPSLGLRILVAEDFETNRVVAVKMLELLGCRVDAVVNGEQAVSAADAVLYDAVLMDLEMPVMDGLTATTTIRKADLLRGRRTPILAFTAHALETDRQRCLAAGMDGYLAKPVRLRDLFDALQRLTSSRSAGKLASMLETAG